MGILDYLNPFWEQYQTPGINPNATVTGTSSKLPNLFMTPNLAEAGLLGTDSEQAQSIQDALQNQATKAGLLSAGISFLTQPRNLQAGSALPYLGRAYQQGMASAGDIYGTGLNQLARQQAFGQKKQYQTIDVGDKIILADPMTGETIKEMPKGIVPGTGQASKTTLVQQVDELKNVNKLLEQDPNNKSLLEARDALLIGLKLKPEAQVPKTEAEQLAKDLSPAQLEYDKKLIGELKSFETTEFADIDKNIAQLDLAIEALENAPEGDITGKTVGLEYDTGTLKYLRPNAAINQERVSEVAQRNLRLILGPQFTAEEGKQLIARAYNPALSQKENIDRIKRLKNQILSSYQSKKDMLNYFSEKGTFKNYKGKALEEVAPKETKKATTVPINTPVTSTIPPVGTIMNGFKFKGGDPSKQENWEKI